MNFYIYPDVTSDKRQKAGPIVGMRLLQKGLKEHIIVHKIKNIIITNSFSDIKNSIIWCWSVFPNKGDIDFLHKNNNRIICGPNTFFSNPSNIKTSEMYIFECKKIYDFILHPNQYAANDLISNEKNTIYEFVYPVDIDKINKIRDNLKDNMNDNKRDIDILIYCKFDYKKNHELLLERYGSKYKITSLIYGQYENNDFIKLALKSKCCIYLSTGETGGIACCEILCCGCPIVSHKSNLNLADDNINCIKLEGNADFYWYKAKIDEIIQKTMRMDNAIIMKDAQIRFSTNNVVMSTINTINKIINHKHA